MDYQETMEEEQLEDEGPEQTFATIGAVYSDGVSLLFDGADEATSKHYKVNRSASFAAGQRVYIVKDSGTYVVICPVGAPGSSGSGIGTSSNYAGASYISSLCVGSPDSHWIINNGQIYHGSATSVNGQGRIGYDNSSPKPLAVLFHYGNAQIGGNANSTIKFFNGNGTTRQSLSTSSQNQGYSGATSSNYLTVLNNMSGILNKLGLLST